MQVAIFKTETTSSAYQIALEAAKYFAGNCNVAFFIYFVRKKVNHIEMYSSKNICIQKVPKNVYM